MEDKIDNASTFEEIDTLRIHISTSLAHRDIKSPLYVLCDKKEKSLRRDTAMVEGTEVKQGEFFT